MASFYGNMKNNSRASFIFDRIYPTRKAMEDALIVKDAEGAIAGDGIFINRYVLIDYHYSLADQAINTNTIDEYYTKVDNSLVTIENFKIYYIRTVNNNIISYEHPTSFSNSNTYYQKKVFIDRYKPDDQIKNGELEQTTSALIETDLYYQHKLTDWQNYRASYDSTVWMKIYADNQERYIMVAELDAKAPILEFIDDAPSCYNGSGHFDMRASTDLNYIYYIPKNWDLIVNQYSPQYTYNNNTDEYYYYQKDKSTNSLWYEKYIKTTDTTAQANKDYFTITFTKVNNTVGKFISNLNYYVLSSGKYVRTTDTIGKKNVNYYIMNQPTLVSNLKVGTNISSAGYYELNNQKKTFDDKVEYPYFNLKGFDKRVSTHVSEQGQGIYFNKVESTQTYPQHVFKHAGGLTVNTYLPNKYFTYIGPKQKVLTNAIYNRDYAYYIGASSNPTSYEYVQLIILDNGTYKPGKPLGTNQSYYYDNDLSNKNYFIKSTQWAKNTAYYEITQAVDNNGNKLVEREDDTYRLDVYLPQIGNTVADIYDILYGTPKIESNKTDGYNNLIGYCSQEQWQTYNCVGFCSATDKASYTTNTSGQYGIATDDRFNLTAAQLSNLRQQPQPTYTKVNNTIITDQNYWQYYVKKTINGQTVYEQATGTNASEYYSKGGYIIPVYQFDANADYWAANRTFSLTDEQFNELSPELYPGLYDIPVYLKTGSNVRPYDLDKFKSTLAPPYDNLGNEDDISVGWALTLLKRYLSELRYLANGDTGDEQHGIGLQSDWTLDDQESFGYIYHRPNIITTYTPTLDTTALPNKKYYKEEVKNGEVVYTQISPLTSGTSLTNLSYTVYELPKSYTNGINSTKTEYIRCSASDVYNANTNYYVWDGASYTRAFYTEETKYIDTDNVIIDHTNNGGVSFQYGYTVVVDANNNITERIYNCYAGTSLDGIALYHNNEISTGIYEKQSVNLFEIHISNNNTDTDAADIYNQIVNLNNLARADLLTFLNNTLKNIGVTYTILSRHQNWPVERTSDQNDNFYYARQNIEYSVHNLDAQHFYDNPTRYYTLVQVPISQEDYEIHNIWNSVLVNVLREP